MTDHQVTQVDVSDEDIHWDFDKAMSYGRYLGLDRLLDSQAPLTEEHDEMLFIIIHQVSELWMKLMLHEVEGASAHIARDEVGPALKMFSRVSRVQEQLIKGWDVLATMTPSDYLAFRDDLGKSSGFQSYQYRSLEYRLGTRMPPWPKCTGTIPMLMRWSPGPWKAPVFGMKPSPSWPVRATRYRPIGWSATGVYPTNPVTRSKPPGA